MTHHNPNRMFVFTRAGVKEDVDFNKIDGRITCLCNLAPALNLDFVDPHKVAQKVVASMTTGMTTEQLDTLAAETAAAMTLEHPDYALLGGRIEIANLHRKTRMLGLDSFSATVERLFHNTRADHRSDAEIASPVVSREFYDCVMRHRDAFDAVAQHDRDFQFFDFFAFRTIASTYLLRIDNGAVIAERPQFMYLRVAVQIHGDDVDRVIETYDLLSRQLFSHATPTMHNSGTPHNQLSSCFLLPIEDDSILGIYNTLRDCAIISKYGGGIGLSAHHVRASGSYIEGTHGTSNGIVPMLRVFNNTARYVDQGGGKRNGSIAVYLEPWHADIESVLELRKNQGAEEQRARDLFYGMWIPDLFMQRVEQNGTWTLFSPSDAPGLHESHGEEFERLYLQYEAKPNLGVKTVNAYALWKRIIAAQIETGMPYMLFKDACNRKSNQQNLGTIASSNLCTEIIQYSSPEEIAVCNLASIALPQFVLLGGKPPNTPSSDSASDSEEKEKEEEKATSCREFGIDWRELERVVRVVTRNLNKLIDSSFYPLEKMRTSNLRHRPMGIGVQGLADMFAMLGLPYESAEATDLNRRVFEAIYYVSLDESCRLAEEKGESYASYTGSPMSRGLLQPDLWDLEETTCAFRIGTGSGSTGGLPVCSVDVADLRTRIAKFGVRNSLLLAPMPTASTAQIMGNTEGMQPFPYMVFTRRVKSGEFTIANKHLVRKLVELGLWDAEMRNEIVLQKGSVQRIARIPADLRDVFKTTWEIKQRTIIDQAADRGRFICQSQSMNIFMQEPTLAKLTALHMYAWKKGLKTGMYYLHTQPKSDPVQFTATSAATTQSASKISDECLNCSA